MIDSKIRKMLAVCIAAIILLFCCKLYIDFAPQYAMKTVEARYISLLSCDGRLANHLFRLATLYGIARTLNRVPLLSNKGACVKYIKQLVDTFPQINTTFRSTRAEDPKSVTVHFGEDSMKYDDVERLRNHSAAHIALTGSYMQSYKYFHQYRSDIQTLLTCKESVRTAVDKSAKQLFGSLDGADTVLCAHIRRTDFVGRATLPTEEKFTRAGLIYIIDRIKEERNGSVSVVFMSDDIKWTKAQHFENIGEARFFYEHQSTASWEFCFAFAFCNVTFITASYSSFAFWIGYLDYPRPVYYRFRSTAVNQKTLRGRDRNPEDSFPKDWNALYEDDGDRIYEAEGWPTKMTRTTTVRTVVKTTLKHITEPTR